MPDPKLPRGALRLAAEALEDGPSLLDDVWARARIALTAALPVIQRDALRQAARRILLLPGLSSGALCPQCHGVYVTRPDVPNPRYRSERWTCRKGHEWDKPDGPRVTEDSLLRMLARGEPLPELPPKEAAE